MKDEFVVATPDDIEIGLEKLQAGEMVTVIPSMKAKFEHSARLRNIPIKIYDDGFCYEFEMKKT